MIGVGAFCYAAAHISLFIADQMFDLIKVASEIVLRLYLTIGFIALLGLAALAITSTDARVRRLGGRRWQRLHQAIYVIAVLVLVHFFQQTKADIAVPIFIASLFGWLMGYRLLIWWRNGRDEPSAWALLALTVAVSALTFAGEAIGIGIAFHVSPLMVLQTGIRFRLGDVRYPPGLAGACGRSLCRPHRRFARATKTEGARQAGDGARKADAGSGVERLLPPTQRRQFGAMPAALMTLALDSVSALRKASNSAGVNGIGSAPSAFNRCFMAGSFNALAISSCSRSTMSFGVAAGAKHADPERIVRIGIAGLERRRDVRQRVVALEARDARVRRVAWPGSAARPTAAARNRSRCGRRALRALRPARRETERGALRSRRSRRKRSALRWVAAPMPPEP